MGVASTTDEMLVLLPLEVMVKALELQFKYHFESNRPSNRLDKVAPELHHCWYKLLIDVA